MGSCWINGGAIAGTIDYYRHVSLNDEERDSRYTISMRNIYRLRTQTTGRLSHHHYAGWPFSGGFIDPDQSGGMSPIADWEGLRNAAYEPWRSGDGGYTRPYYIRGYVFDSNGNPMAGARVRSYVTATGVLDGFCYSAGDGSYEVPCTASGAHFVVAYLDGSPETAGVSIDNLVPTL